MVLEAFAAGNLLYSVDNLGYGYPGLHDRSDTLLTQLTNVASSNFYTPIDDGFLHTNNNFGSFGNRGISKIDANTGNSTIYWVNNLSLGIDELRVTTDGKLVAANSNQAIILDQNLQIEKRVYSDWLYGGDIAIDPTGNFIYLAKNGLLGNLNTACVQWDIGSQSDGSTASYSGFPVVGQQVYGIGCLNNAGSRFFGLHVHNDGSVLFANETIDILPHPGGGCDFKHGVVIQRLTPNGGLGGSYDITDVLPPDWGYLNNPIGNFGDGEFQPWNNGLLLTSDTYNGGNTCWIIVRCAGNLAFGGTQQTVLRLLKINMDNGAVELTHDYPGAPSAGGSTIGLGNMAVSTVQVYPGLGHFDTDGTQIRFLDTFR